jgi:hypothetical protein
LYQCDHGDRDQADEDLHEFGNRSVISRCLSGYIKGDFGRNPGVMSLAAQLLLHDTVIEDELTLLGHPAGGVKRGGCSG